MHLLHAQEDGMFSLDEFFGNDIPSYAILSHTWGADSGEVTFKDIIDGTSESKCGYAKIRFCGKKAVEDGLTYFWVDSCCIDKSSSTELSEAINSMFRWYQNAVKCYVYLSDVSVDDSTSPKGWISDFKKSRWFTRGWTLQELIAPNSVEFFSKEEQLLGDKSSLEQTLHDVTRIDIQALRGSPLLLFDIEDRMSWAVGRNTKREEDEAYCLLGIFNIHMPLLYGEGRVKAMHRLRKEIEAPLRHEAPALSTEYLIKRSKQKGEELTEQQKGLLMCSLNFEQIDARHLTIKKAHFRTCQWLLRSPQYLDWLRSTKLDGNHGFLWIKGKAGSGKSTLMKYALSNARETMKDVIIIAFFFNARGTNLEKSTIGTYRSLLMQLLERFPALQHVFNSLHLSSPTINRNHEWNAESLKTLLEQVILNLGGSSVFCFIDALDECEEEQIRDMIAFFEHVGEQAKLANVQIHVCFSSRHYPHITIRHGVELVLESQKGHEQDITNYLEDRLRIGNSKIATEIHANLHERASGIFMWVVLVVAILNKEYDSGRIHVLRKRLQEIPNDLHQLFRDILTRDSHNRDELILCIQWILFAERPLTLSELYFVVLSGTESDNLSRWIPDVVTESTMKRFLLDSSKGLAEVTKSGTPTVQFIHESVKEFLLKGSGLRQIWPELEKNWEGQSHERLARLCFRYISIDILTALKLPESLPRASLAEVQQQRWPVILKFPFVSYAALAILYHANAAAGCGISQENLMQTFPLTQWIVLVDMIKGHASREYPYNTSLLYILAREHKSHLIRLHSPVSRYLRSGQQLSWPPGFVKITGSNRDGIRAILIADVDEDVPVKLSHNFKFSQRFAVLSYGKELENGVMFICLLETSKNLAKVLLKNEEPEGTLLSWAAMEGHEGIVKQLLALGKVDVECKEKHDGRTPLMWAASEGHEGVVKQLLTTGKAEVESRDELNRWTPLLWAANKGHAGVVKQLLLTGGADSDSKDGYGRTSLVLAMMGRHDEVVKLLEQYTGRERHRVP